MLRWLSVVLPSSVPWENQPLPRHPATTTGSPGRDLAQDQPRHHQGSAAITGRMLTGPWTRWNNPLLRWDAGQCFLKCLQDLRARLCKGVEIAGMRSLNKSKALESHSGSGF